MRRSVDGLRHRQLPSVRRQPELRAAVRRGVTAIALDPSAAGGRLPADRPDADANGKPYAHAVTHPNAHAVAHPNAGAHAFAHSDVSTHANAHAFAYTYRCSDGHANSDRLTHYRRDAHAYGHAAANDRTHAADHHNTRTNRCTDAKRAAALTASGANRYADGQRRTNGRAFAYGVTAGAGQRQLRRRDGPA